jgi:hypothetical protein
VKEDAAVQQLRADIKALAGERDSQAERAERASAGLQAANMEITALTTQLEQCQNKAEEERQV